jgi:hypothetical protein
MRQKTLALVMMGLATATAAWAVDEQSAQQSQQTVLAVTIYNSDLALVKDARKVKLRNGENRLAWREVSARIQPETALLRTTSGSGLELLEQNFDFDLLTPQKMLEKSVGETIRVIKTHPMTGVESTEYATVLAANNGFVLKYSDRVETELPGNCPSGLRRGAGGPARPADAEPAIQCREGRRARRRAVLSDRRPGLESRLCRRADRQGRQPRSERLGHAD